MKALKVDGEILAVWTKTAPIPTLAKLGQIVDVEPCPTCHGAQYIEKKHRNRRKG